MCWSVSLRGAGGSMFGGCLYTEPVKLLTVFMLSYANTSWLQLHNLVDVQTCTDLVIWLLEDRERMYFPKCWKGSIMKALSRELDSWVIQQKVKWSADLQLRDRARWVGLHSEMISIIGIFLCVQMTGRSCYRLFSKKQNAIWLQNPFLLAFQSN